MANWNYTQLSCNDLQKFTEIIKANPFKWPHTGQDYEDKPVELDSEGIAHTHSCRSLPSMEITELSRNNPDLTFTAKYSLEEEEFDTDYFVEYRNGEDYPIEARPNYSICCNGNEPEKEYKPHMGNHFDSLYERAVLICKRLDVPVKNTDEKGKTDIRIDFIVEKILITVEDDEYQMKILKWGSRLEIESCLRKKKVTNVELVPIYEEIPF